MDRGIGGFRALRSLAVSGAIGILVAACGGGGTTTGEQLAADQTLRFPINDDIGTFDGAHLTAAVDFLAARNMFDSVVKFDDNLKIVPDLAKSWDVSSDGLTYTFRLNKDAKFSNGDPVKAGDVIYSWNRAAATQDDYAINFSPVVGYDEVEKTKGATKTMTGLSKTDDATVVAKLSHPAGWWLSALALGGASYVVDEKVIKAKGEDTWWTTPDGLVGTGPFKMTKRTPKASLDFEPVANWWGGSTGNLKKVHVDVIADQASWTQKYETGGFDLIGFMDMKPTPEDIIRYKAGTHSKELTIGPGARATWLGFDWLKGPFKGADGADGRKAFSLAIDRSQLVDVALAKGATGIAGTGGLIGKGLKGYTGDGSNPMTKFDPAAAKALYQKWDPDGSKVRGLKYAFNATAENKAVAENLQAQWKANLNVNIGLDTIDRQTFFKARSKHTYTLFRASWLADYDHPQDWFDNLWLCNVGSDGSGFCDKNVDDIVKKADEKTVDSAVPDYVRAGKMMADDSYAVTLFYGTKPYLIKPYVKGAGGNALNDYYWTGIKILQH